MCKSRMMRSGRSSRALRTASIPSLASYTAWPDCSRTARSNSRPGALSSATSTVFIGPLKGNRKREAASIARLALEPDPPAMLLHESLRDGKTQSGASAARGSGAHLIELIKYGLVLVFGNTDSSVRDRDLCEAAARLGLDSYLPAVRRKLHRITQKVVQNLLEAEAIRDNGYGDRDIGPNFH